MENYAITVANLMNAKGTAKAILEVALIVPHLKSP